MEAKITNEAILGFIIIWFFGGIIYGLYLLGFFTPYISSMEPLLGGLYIISTSVMLILETYYEGPGFKSLKDLTPRNMISFAISIIGLVTGFWIFAGFTVPSNAIPLIGVLVLALSVFILIETRE